MIALSYRPDSRLFSFFFVLIAVSGFILLMTTPGGTEPTPSGILATSDESSQRVMLLNGSELSELIGYPRLAKDAGIEGVVTLKLTVNHLGAISGLKVLESGHPLLETACIEKLHYGQFQPALRNHLAVSGYTILSITFDSSRDLPSIS